jgi:hypothetical protein
VKLVTIHEWLYLEFIHFSIDERNLEPLDVVDMFEKPEKYRRDFEEYLLWRSEADYDRRMGSAA